jgi:hypothetical protein
MRKLNKIGYMLMGMALAFIIGITTPAYAATQDIVKQLTAVFTSNGKPISLYVNNTKVDKDSNSNTITPFMVKGTIYLPVKAVADALGKDITWDPNTASIKINDKMTSAPDTTSPSTNMSAPSTSDDTTKVVVTKDSNGSISESIDYKFVLDQDLIGQWEQIDFVANPNDFDGKDISRKDYVWPVTHNFYNDGKMISTSVNANGGKETQNHTWTKNYVLNMGANNTVSSYQIKQINGKTFMFVQWKSGDYTIRGQKPSYFVLIKTSDTPESDLDK